jgi:hypothetical protein
MEDKGLDWDSGWNDQRRLRIWQSNGRFGGDNHGSAAGTTITEGNNTGLSSLGAVYPGMTISPGTRTLLGSWGKPGNNATYYGGNTANGYQVFHWVDPQDETDIAYGTGAEVVYNNTGAYTSTPDDNNQTGGIQVFDNHEMSWYIGANKNPPGLFRTDNLDGSLNSSYGGAYIVEKVKKTSSNHILDRFASPHIAVQGDYIHVAYHDRIDRSIKYWWNKRGAEYTLAEYYSNTNKDIDDVNIPSQRWINIDGGYNDYDGYTTTATSRVRIGTDRTTGDSNGEGKIPTDATKNAAGEYNAIDFNSSGYPVIAYYDMKNRNLKLAYADNARPLAGADWVVQNVVNPGPISGQYVSMRIDRSRNDRIHLSYYKSDTGELAYVSGTKKTGNRVVDAAAIVSGYGYRINTPGTTSWTSAGAANNNVNTFFVASGSSPSGTGDAYKYNPVNLVTPKTAAGLVAGNGYRITTPGDADWTKVGASANTANTSFIATGALNAGTAWEYTRGGTQTRNNLVVGNVYQIYIPGSANWMSVGASSNAAGTVFIATGKEAGGTSGNVHAQTYSGTKASTALLTGTGSSTKIYRIITVGDADWTKAGATSNNVDTVFVSTRALSFGAASEYTPAFDQGYDFSNGPVVVVDNTGMAGKWSDISIDRNGNPWITYQDITRSGTFDGAKMAYLPGAQAKDNTLWKLPANWETMNIPGRYRVQDARLSIENPLDTEPATPTWQTGWDAAVGFQSDYFRIAYFQDN